MCDTVSVSHLLQRTEQPPGELSGSSVVGSKDAEVDKVYRPRSTGEGSVSEAIKTKRRISWFFKNRILQSTGAIPTSQNLLALSSTLWEHIETSVIPALCL